MVWEIYQITNIASQMSYIGMTTTGIQNRWNAHCRRSRKAKYYFHKAIKKYGINNFCVKKLDEAYSLEEANVLEQYYISTLNTLVPNGYNMTAGGDGTLGHAHSKESKQKMSLTHKNKVGLNLGKKFSKQTRIKMSLAKSGILKSETHKFNMCLGHKNRKEVIINGKWYPSLNAARKDLKMGKKKFKELMINTFNGDE